MSNDQLKESSLFSRKEGEKAADHRFIVKDSKEPLEGHIQEEGNVVALSFEEKKILKRISGRLKVRAPKQYDIEKSEFKPFADEDAERLILEGFNAPEPPASRFLNEPSDAEEEDEEQKIDIPYYQSGFGSRTKDPSYSTREFGPADSDEDDALPVLGSTYSTVTSHGEALEASRGKAQVSTETVEELLEKVETVVCTVCQEKNIVNSNYCAHCGSLVNFGHRQHTGYSEISKEPTAMSWTPNQDLRAFLIAINDDGTEGKRIPIEFMETIIGREMDNPFPTDAFLSPKHAKLTVRNSRLFIQDLSSLNGTFIKLRQEKVIESGDTFLMGRQVLSFEEFPENPNIKLRAPDGTRKMGSPSTDRSFRLLQIGIGGILQNVYCLPKSGAQLGRERGDIIFPHDKFMSSRHAQIFRRNDGNFVLADLNSSNGTWIKIWESTPLETQDYIFMGQQLFRVFIDR